MSITKQCALKMIFLNEKNRKIWTIFDLKIDFESKNFAIFDNFLRKSMQDLKLFYRSIGYWLSINDGPVICVKVCDKSVVILQK